MLTSKNLFESYFSFSYNNKTDSLTQLVSFKQTIRDRLFVRFNRNTKVRAPL